MNSAFNEKHRILLLNFYSVLNTKGGAEHVMSKMANAFVERGHAVKIVFLQNTAGEPAYPLDARVELENCAKNPVPWRWRKKVLRIRSWFIRDKNRRKAFRSHRMDQARACQISPAILKFRPDIIHYRFPAGKRMLHYAVFHGSPSDHHHDACIAGSLSKAPANSFSS